MLYIKHLLNSNKSKNSLPSLRLCSTLVFYSRLRYRSSYRPSAVKIVQVDSVCISIRHIRSPVTVIIHPCSPSSWRCSGYYQTLIYHSEPFYFLLTYLLTAKERVTCLVFYYSYYCRVYPNNSISTDEHDQAQTKAK